MRSIISLLSFLFVTSIYSQPIGYEYGKTVAINSSVVTGTTNLINFPLLFKVTDPDLRSKANGGNVQSNNGYDIVFTTDGCAAPLAHQVEKYDPVNGELVCWIKIPLLNYSTNTVINIYYGNITTTLTTSSSDVWNNDYLSVLHLNENPANSAPQMSDATGNSNSGTCNGSMTSTNSVVGKIGSSVSFDETDDGITIPDIDYTQSFTISFWFNIGEVTGTSFQYLYSHGTYGTTHSTNIYFGEDNLAFATDRQMLKNIFQDANDATNTSGLDAGTTLVDGNWHYYTFVVGNSGGATVYIDGVQTAYVSFLGGNSYNPSGNIFLGCRSDLSNTRYYGGKIDEFRILNEPRSADWISTEYKNQNNPTAYYNVSAQFPSSFICQALPIELISFNAELTKDKDVNLKWETASESNCENYEIEKSIDAQHFFSIGNVKAKNHHHTLTSYHMIDSESSQNDIIYYRLKQIDADSSYAYSKIISIHKTNALNSFPAPNPFDHFLDIIPNHDSENKEVTVSVYNNIGQTVYSAIYQPKDVPIRLDLSELDSGIYYLEVDGQNKERFKILKK